MRDLHLDQVLPRRLRATPITPVRPVPSRMIVAGSGTGEVGEPTTKENGTVSVTKLTGWMIEKQLRQNVPVKTAPIGTLGLGVSVKIGNGPRGLPATTVCSKKLRV